MAVTLLGESAARSSGMQVADKPTAFQLLLLDRAAVAKVRAAPVKAPMAAPLPDERDGDHGASAPALDAGSKHEIDDGGGSGTGANPLQPEREPQAAPAPLPNLVRRSPLAAGGRSCAWTRAASG